MVTGPDFSGLAEEYAASRPGYPRELFEWFASVVKEREAAWDVATGSGQAAVGLAEESGLNADSMDLVAVAAAIHWFDLEPFFAEVCRVLRGGGVVAAWTYHVAHVEPPLDRVLRPFYRDVVASYFAPGARLVDARYEGITLPGEELPAPSFRVSVRWTAEDVLRFVRTWSGVRSCIEVTGSDPVAEIEDAVRDVLGGGPAREIAWPLYLRAARL